MNFRISLVRFAALAAALAVSATAFAETRTISWSPVTTYTDGTPITGKTIAYSIYWATVSGLPATMTPVATGVTRTSATFDPAGQGMTPGQTVYFRMKTVLGTGEESEYSSALSWVVPNTAPPAAPSLTGVSIAGPGSVNEGANGVYSATATWNDGSTTSVTPSWSVSGAYASINTAGVLTAGAVSADQIVTVTAGYESGGVSRTATKSVTIVNAAPALTAISVNGPSTVAMNASAAYTVTAIWSDGSNAAVATAWSVAGPAATISASGMLAAGSVASDQTVTVSATATGGGVTRTASKSVTIAYVAPHAPETPAAPAIGPTASAANRWTLSWDPVARYADGLPLPPGRVVRYTAYWSRDPALEAGSLVPIGSSLAGTSREFTPLAEGMAGNDRVYFAVRATLDTGEASALSEALAWKVSNKGPAPPTRGQILRKK